MDQNQRKTTETRKVPYTRGGLTYLVDEDHEVTSYVTPRDTDVIVMRLLVCLTGFIVAVAITWSTVAIGSLLSRMAPSWVSYLVAAVFDLSWVSCMAAEYLMRYDRRRVWIPRGAGVLMLGVSVLAIGVEGGLSTGSAVIGTIGGTISVLAKGLWTVVMAISARKLTDLDRQWYEQATSAANAEIAVTAVTRKLNRSRALIAREAASLELVSADDRLAATTPFEAPAVEVIQGNHQSVVYIVRNGDRVKIGRTTNLRKRIKSLALRRADILLVLEGGRKKEEELHTRFSGFRDGSSEWFRFTPEIRTFIRDSGPSARMIPEQTRKPQAKALPPIGAVPQINGSRVTVSEAARGGIRNGVRNPEDLLEEIRKAIPTVNEESARRIIRAELKKIAI